MDNKLLTGKNLLCMHQLQPAAQSIMSTSQVIVLDDLSPLCSRNEQKTAATELDKRRWKPTCVQ